MSGERNAAEPAHDTAARLVAGSLSRGLSPEDASRQTRQRARDWLGEGHDATVRPRGPAGGAPRFAPGWIGSLSHTNGAAAALVVPTALGSSRVCGVDIEPLAPLPPEVLEFVLTGPERAWVARHQAADPAAGRRLFSAKECVHKAVHPATGIFLEFDEVRIDGLDAAAGPGAWRPEPLSVAARQALAGWHWVGGWRNTAGFGLAWLLGTKDSPLPLVISLHF